MPFRGELTIACTMTFRFSRERRSTSNPVEKEEKRPMISQGGRGGGGGL